jgi:NADH-quinone oxidoreductase subunit H
MINTLDQIFVLLRHWLVSFLPAAWQPLVGVLLSVAAIVCLFPALFALTTVFERKGLARIQNRLGPNRVGPFGLLQPIADGIKSLTKEDIVPLSADAAVHFLSSWASRCCRWGVTWCLLIWTPGCCFTLP